MLIVLGGEVERREDGAAFFESLHIRGIVVRGLIFPAAKENSNPFEG